jgi:hypothetical protein
MTYVRNLNLRPKNVGPQTRSFHREAAAISQQLKSSRFQEYTGALTCNGLGRQRDTDSQRTKQAQRHGRISFTDVWCSRADHGADILHVSTPHRAAISRLRNCP